MFLTALVFSTGKIQKPSDLTSMSMKYCDHYHTHGCTELVAAAKSLCVGCQLGTNCP